MLKVSTWMLEVLKLFHVFDQLIDRQVEVRLISRVAMFKVKCLMSINGLKVSPGILSQT